MKKFFQKLFIFLLIIVFITVSIWAYFKFSKTKNYDLISIVPTSAIFIIESDNLSMGWNKLSNSEIWHHLKTTAVFSEYDNMVNSINNIISNNKIVAPVFTNRKILVSAHMISGNNYDFLYLIQSDNASKLSFMAELASFLDYSISRRKYNNEEIIDFIDVKSKNKISTCFIGNIMAVSFSGALIEEAIDQKQNISLLDNNDFINISESLQINEMFSIYINNSKLKDLMSCYFSDNLDLAESFGKSTTFTAANVNMHTNKLVFKGYMGINDSISSYIRALSQNKPVRTYSHNIVSQNTALYLSLSFSDFNSFINELKKEFRNADTNQFDNYEKELEKIEKFLKIDFNKQFFSWIDNEIAMIKLQPSANSKEDDMVVFINTSDINKAKQGLSEITKQIKKRSPAKFKEYEYRDFPINIFSVKGFFKLFLGKMFQKLDVPYFTYIDNYVVFSNSTGALMEVIDDYLLGKTLGKDETFKLIHKNFGNHSNVNIYIQMPKMYKHLYKSSTGEFKKGLTNNTELILSFVNIGVQLSSSNNGFDFYMELQHCPDIFYNFQITNIERAAEDIYFRYYDTLGFMFNLAEIPMIEGSIKLHYDNENILAEGNVINGLAQGIWRIYYPSGNLSGVIRLNEGKLNGVSRFFFDNNLNKEKTIVEFDNDVIINMYKELYSNGQTKCLLEVKDGKLHGKAEYFYENGRIKMRRNYKDGLSHGKWIVYNELGKEIDKTRYRKGNEK